jgi:hypothetical protein
MEQLTYQKILAETYEENSRNLLVHQNEYEDDDQVEEHEQQDYDDRELEDQEEFNRVQDRHDLKNVVAPKKPFEDKGKASVRYNKDVKTLVYNIDSRFRNATVVTTSSNTFTSQSSSNFLFRLSKILKNVVSAKLTSFELPNTFYTFSNSRQNKAFMVTVGGVTKEITVNDGNYLQSGSSTLIDYTALALDYEAALNLAFSPPETFTVVYNTSSNRIVISNTTAPTPSSFTLSFAPINALVNYGVTSTNQFNGVGYFLGYQNYQYSGSTSYTSEACPQLVGDNYIYLEISDWDNVQHQDYNQSSFFVFTKILLPTGKNTIIIDTPITNPTNKEYHFMQPTNINLLQIRLVDAFGYTVDLEGSNISMTLEFQEVLNMELYEKMRDM